ncbi:hypothetical protein BpHYR1_030004 [Brachionus plicatilis]|uniref:Uncharacterized protein n=1 Tax=Brachionus plicatilis TaxID=10195 RepID=A0A3M7QV45_BRAPC|nr:hypothetical protein BpHYR1_030004 [Brachionus plicatilis]
MLKFYNSTYKIIINDGICQNWVENYFELSAKKTKTEFSVMSRADGSKAKGRISLILQNLRSSLVRTRMQVQSSPNSAINCLHAPQETALTKAVLSAHIHRPYDAFSTLQPLIWLTWIQFQALIKTRIQVSETNE